MALITAALALSGVHACGIKRRTLKTVRREKTVAQAMQCDMCQQENAIMIQTNLTDGSAITVGAACLVPYFLATADEMRKAAGTQQSPGGPDSAASGPETPEAAKETSPRSEAVSGAPVDAWVADAAALREVSPGATYTATEHMHECPGGGAFVHKHAKGAQQHEHECPHASGWQLGDKVPDGNV